MLEFLLQLHTWPDGFREDMEYEVTPMIAELTAEHARKAKELGIPPKKHIRNVLAVPGYAPAQDGFMGWTRMLCRACEAPAQAAHACSNAVRAALLEVEKKSRSF